MKNKIFLNIKNPKIAKCIAFEKDLKNKNKQYENSKKQKNKKNKRIPIQK